MRAAVLAALDPGRSLPLVGLQAWYDASRLQIGAAQFNAANSEYLSVADHADFDWGTGDGSISIWFRFDSVLAATVYLWTKWEDGARRVNLRIDNNSILTFIALYDGTIISITGTTALAANRWYHVVVVVDRDSAANTKLYLNSVDDTAGVPTVTAADISNTGPIQISGIPGSNYFPGRISKLGFWKGKVLSAAEVTSLYNSGAGLHHSQLSGSLLTNLISYYDLNEKGGQRNDSTANAHHLTDNNTVSCAPSMTPETPADATLVYHWEDLSGNGNHATQATEASKLAYKVNIVNGRPVLRGDGVADHLRADGIATALTGSDVALTIVTVCKPRVLPASFIWGLGRAASDNSFMRMVPDATPTWSVRRQDDTAAGKNMDLGTPVAGTTAIVTVVFTGTLGRLFVDGAQVGADTDLDVGAMTVDQFTVGGLTRTGVDGVFDGDIPEMVVYNRALSASEIARVSRYLGRRYGIAVS